VLPWAVSCVAMPAPGYLLSNVGATLLSAALAVFLLRTIGSRPGNPGKIGRAVAGTGIFISLLGSASIAYIFVVLSQDAPASSATRPVNVIAVINLVLPCVAGLIAIVITSVNPQREKTRRALLGLGVGIAGVAPLTTLVVVLGVISLACNSVLWFVPR